MTSELDFLRAAVIQAGTAADASERARGISTELRRTTSLVALADLLEALADEIDRSRRQLTRFGFDLHDGPLQEVAALGSDIHLFREQLGGSLEGHEHGLRLIGRVDDLIARLIAIDTNLRELATAAESSSLMHRPLRETIQQIVSAFSTSNHIRATIELDPDLDSEELTVSQRIALLRILQGALANVVQHSTASEAIVTVTRSPYGIEAQISDDGRGFDVAATLRRAVGAGRLGLVGMRERARLLGGEFSVDSRPGGPTTIRVRLPRWHPPRAQA